MSSPANPPKIYFFNCEEPDNFQSDILCVAEGLRELGVPFHARADCWRLSPEPGDFLFRASPEVDPFECDVLVFPSNWFHWVRLNHPIQGRAFPEGLFQSGRPWKAVRFDIADGYRSSSFEEEFRRFDLVFRVHSNRLCFHPENSRPWQHGLSGRMIQALEGAIPFFERQRAILWNFGASHPYPHGCRDAAEKAFRPAIENILPLDETRDDLSQEPVDAYERLMWNQTNQRHSQAYYERLKSTAACAAFCGELAPPTPFDPTSVLAGGRKAKIRRLAHETLAKLSGRPPRSIQWDSWRFWEALAAGCAVFNLDLDLYGVALPVMPENGRHYIGVDLRRPREAAERVLDDPGLLERVAREGQAWVMEHYAPKPVAERFLDAVSPGWRGAGGEA